MYVENIFRQPSRLVLRHPVPASEYGDGFFCSVMPFFHQAMVPDAQNRTVTFHLGTKFPDGLIPCYFVHVPEAPVP
jgi:hypothetical protein